MTILSRQRYVTASKITSLRTKLPGCVTRQLASDKKSAAHSVGFHPTDRQSPTQSSLPPHFITSSLCARLYFSSYQATAEHLYIQPRAKCRQNRCNVMAKTLAQISDKNMLVYQTETQTIRKFNRGELRRRYSGKLLTSIHSRDLSTSSLTTLFPDEATAPTFTEFHVPKGNTRFKLENPRIGNATPTASQVASVPIPWDMVLKSRLLGQEGHLYVTERC
ncbi:hypothetical protein V2W45_120685 [Cenococcum geophilum]